MKVSFEDKEAGVEFREPATLELIVATVEGDAQHKYHAKFKHDGPPKVRKRLAPLQPDPHAGHNHAPLPQPDPHAGHNHAPQPPQ